MKKYDYPPKNTENIIDHITENTDRNFSQKRKNRQNNYQRATLNEMFDVFKFQIKKNSEPQFKKKHI